MCWARRGVAAVFCIILGTSAVEAATRVTHKQVQAIKVTGQGGASLQSITRTSDGRIVALLGPARYAGIRAGASDKPENEIQVFDKDGKELKRWSIPFAGQAVGAGPSGSILVGGNGKIAQYNADGKLLIQAEMPHMAAILADKEGLRKRAEEQIESQKESIERTKKVYAQQIKVLKSQIATLEESDKEGLLPDDKRKLTAAEERRLKRLKQQLAAYESVQFGDGEAQVETIMQQLLQRASMISGISANEKDVFVVCGEQKGYGFAAWRMDHKFENPTKVLSELRGCCGQMDVQAVGDELFVAENTKHRVGRYDRDGQRIEEFGTTAGGKNQDGFGGCCNPMNLCCGFEGQILTAESEGIIRRFSPTGEYLGLVGRVTLTGGCKNVAVAASPDGERIYFCDLPGSRIIVMGPVTDEAEAEALAKPPKPEAGVPSEAEADDEDSDDDDAKSSAVTPEDPVNVAAQRKIPRFDVRTSRGLRPSSSPRVSLTRRAGPRLAPQVVSTQN